MSSVIQSREKKLSANIIFFFLSLYTESIRFEWGSTFPVNRKMNGFHCDRVDSEVSSEPFFFSFAHIELTRNEILFYALFWRIMFYQTSPTDKWITNNLLGVKQFWRICAWYTRAQFTYCKAYTCVKTTDWNLRWRYLHKLHRNCAWLNDRSTSARFFANAIFAACFVHCVREFIMKSITTFYRPYSDG